MNLDNYEPQSVWERDLAHYIGLKALLRLEREYGGQYIYIRANEPDPNLCYAIGPTAARQLTAHFGGSDIYVPRVTLIRIRNDEIKRGRNTGKTIHELAAKFRLSTHQIRKIIKQRRYEPNAHNRNAVG
ncbi:hypothetical protein AMBLS11_12450 [Alteromonas macleodii str. 'Black Sea 11']|nr:hypothetical protein AMBLS11_12450 [Alteromonas macleodii str. 'Black Sea 11']